MVNGYTSFQGSWLWGTLKAREPDVVLIGYVVQDARAAYTDKSQAILQKDIDSRTISSTEARSIWPFVQPLVPFRSGKGRGSGDEGVCTRPPRIMWTI